MKDASKDSWGSGGQGGASEGRVQRQRHYSHGGSQPVCSWAMTCGAKGLLAAQSRSFPRLSTAQQV